MATFQKCLYQGTILTGKDGTTEFGRTYTNGFNGLRFMFGSTSVVGNTVYYPGGNTPVIHDQGTATLVDTIDNAATDILNNGGYPTALHLSPYAASQLRHELQNQVRYTMADATGGFVAGGHVAQVDTVAGRLDLVVIPGNAIGTYLGPAGSAYAGVTCEDIYMLDESVLSFPFLGSANPTTLEIQEESLSTVM